MYDLTESEKAIFAEMEEQEKIVKSYHRSTHKCFGCVWSKWHDNDKVLCTYSPVSCIKEKPSNEGF